MELASGSPRVPGMEVKCDDAGIEEEIEIELSKISLSSSEADNSDADLSAEASSDSELISDELPESVIHYLNFVKTRSQNAERLILQDLENVEVSSDIYSVVPNNASHCLAQLASEYNEDPEELKKRVLSEIEHEEQQMSEAPDNTTDPKNDGDIPSHEVADGCSLTDDGDTIISFSFREVEERCNQEYELWVEKQKELEHERIKQLKAKREMEETQREEEEKKRQLRQEELEAERMKLEMFHAQQQAVMEEELLKEEEAWQEQLRHHKELINNLHTQIQKEKRAFDEQQAMERQQWKEQQNMAAIKIQATFRAFSAYKKYVPLLKQWRMELKRKRELQEAMEREMKEKQERLNRRALEKKEQEEKERKSREDQEKEEHAAKMKRLEEYEMKKEIMRLQREQLMLEELKREENVQLKFVIEKKINSENMDKDLQLAKKEQEIGKAKDNKPEKIKRCLGPQNTNTTLEIADKEKEIQIVKEQEKDTDEKIKLIEEKEENKQTQEISHEEEKEDEKNGMMLEKVGHDNRQSEDEKLKSGKEEHLTELNNEKSVENDINYLCLVTTELQRNIKTNALNMETIRVLNQDSNMHSKYINMDIQLDSGDTGQMEGSYASENKKMELGLEEIHEEATNLWAKGENSVSLVEQPLMFSDSIEEKRLAWMKTCKSWSRIYREHQRKKIVERSRPRKCSASLMPPLSAAMIIQAGPWNALQQVTTVTFQDLPGCSLSTLSECSRLQFLSLRRCGLLALEGLSSCKNLKYIDVEENNIQVIDCENLENLCILLLNKNKISSLHGLFGCTNLWNLELSYNKITRIGGLESLKNLQQLVVSHNQLISTKGLSDTPTLVYIDCSFNHLTHVEGIENCGLLQILKLQGNNLNEFPSLENHILLRELYLEDNSISTLEKCPTYWLPLLRILFLSQNSLTQLAPIFSYISLEKLDISNNCLLDTKNIIQWLGGCDSLRELSLHGNPLLQEENWRCTLLKILPSLKILNDENVSSDTEIPGERIKNRTEPGSFAALCQGQIQEIDLVSKKATTRLIDEFSTEAVQLQCLYFTKLMKLSSEHRYVHEYGMLNNTEGEEPEKQTYHLNQEAINITEKNNFFITGVKENKQVSLNMPERWITSGHTQTMSVNSFMALAGMGKNQEYKQKKAIQCSLNHNGQSKDNNILISPKRNKFSKQIMASNGGNYIQHFDSLQNLAATVIQSYWRSYRVRKEIDFFTRPHLAATVIQSFWRSYCVKKKRVSYSKEGDHFMDKHKAATILQALWKGFRLRKKLASALAAVKTDEVEDDYREVNVDDFLFDESAVENEWPALDSTRFLSQTPLFSDRLPSPKYNEPARSEDNSHHLKQPPHKTWQLKDRPKSFLSGNSWISNRSEKSTLSRQSSMLLPQKSSLRLEKEEKISEEWGFKDISTAQLMLKRAHKMKVKKSSAKKLDPAVRLALFKNNENKHPPMKPPKKAQTAKTSCFEGKEEEFSHIDKSAEKMERSKERTYKWLHTQVWDYEGASPRNEKCKHFLPEIDPEVLKGGKVQLVTSPVRREDTDLELVSMTSGNTLTQNREKNNQPHRHSPGSSKKDAPAPERSHLGPSQKERISFRDHPVHLSGGWGSGKKKAKPLK